MTPERRQSLYLFLSLATLAVFFLTLHHYISRGVDNNAFMRVQHLTQSGAAILEDWLGTQARATDILADLADSPVAAERLFADFAHSSGSNGIHAAMRLDGMGITLFDESGVWSFGREALNFQIWRDLFHSSSDMVIMRGPVEPLRGEHQEMLFLRAFFSHNGKRLGELALRLPLNVLSNKLDSLPLLSRGERRYFVTDHKGTILSCTRHGGDRPCLREDPGLRAMIGAPGPFEVGPKTFANMDFIVARADVGTTGWTLHVLSPLEYEVRIRPQLTGAFGAAWLFLSGFVLLLGYHSGKHGLYKDLSRRDHLTGAGNRLAFEHALQLLRKKNDFPICLLILDVDGLKILNDSFGHKAGDALLRRVFLLLQRCIREDDSIYRIGGDEFAVLLPGATAQAGQAMVGRIGAQAAQLRERTSLPPIFVSLGLAEARNSEELGGLFLAADKAMYENKEKGRDISRKAISAWIEASGNLVDRRGA